MNKNIKIILVVLGIILLGGLIVLATQEPSSIEETANEEDVVIEESEDLAVNQELEEPTDKESEKEEGKLEENEKTEKKTTDLFIQCLKEKGVVIYGSEWCPYCKQLTESLGGYEIVNPIYVECTVEEERCMNEMIGRGVPEIQIEGEMYKGSRDPERIAEATGCVYYQ